MNEIVGRSLMKLLIHNHLIALIKNNSYCIAVVTRALACNKTRILPLGTGLLLTRFVRSTMENA